MFETLFPSQIYYGSLKKNLNYKKLNKELIQEAYQIQKVDEEGRRWCEKNYPGGYTSYSSLCQLNHLSSTFHDLQKMIDHQVRAYIKKLDMDIQPKALEMTTCWVNIMSPAVIHTGHIHPLSVISGTYYVAAPKGSGGLKFEDPRLGFFMGSPSRKLNARKENQRFVTVEPKPGNLVLFESWMRHEVCQNLGDGDRISVSFNYDWVHR